jgi:hypothetical protein
MHVHVCVCVCDPQSAILQVLNFTVGHNYVFEEVINNVQKNWEQCVQTSK